MTTIKYDTMTSDTTIICVTSLWFKNDCNETCVSFKYKSDSGLIYLTMNIINKDTPTSKISPKKRKSIEKINYSNFEIQSSNDRFKPFYIGDMLTCKNIMKYVRASINSHGGGTTSSEPLIGPITTIHESNIWYVFDTKDICVTYTYNSKEGDLVFAQSVITKPSPDYDLTDGALNSIEREAAEMFQNPEDTYNINVGRYCYVDEIRYKIGTMVSGRDLKPHNITMDIIVAKKLESPKPQSPKSQSKSKSPKSKSKSSKKNESQVVIEAIEETTYYDETRPLVESKAVNRSLIIDEVRTPDGNHYMISYKFDKSSGELMFFHWLSAIKNQDPTCWIREKVTGIVRNEIDRYAKVMTIPSRSSRADIIDIITSQF